MGDNKKLIAIVLLVSDCLVYSMIIALTRCAQYVAHFDVEGLFPYQTLRFIPFPCHVIFILIGIYSCVLYKNAKK